MPTSIHEHSNGYKKCCWLQGLAFGLVDRLRFSHSGGCVVACHRLNTFYMFNGHLKNLFSEVPVHISSAFFKIRLLYLIFWQEYFITHSEHDYFVHYETYILQISSFIV